MKKLGSSNWKVTYHSSVVKQDIPKLGKAEALRIRRAIERKLITDPALYGVPLRGSLKQLWKFRVGDWRTVFMIAGNEIRVLVIAHRKEVYDIAEKRR